MDDRRSEDKEDKDPSLFRGHSIQLGFDKFHVNLTYSCSGLDPFALERERSSFIKPRGNSLNVVIGVK